MNLTEQEIEKIKNTLSPKEHGELRSLFYKRNGLPKQGLYTNRKIFELCKIPIEKLDSLQYEGVLRFLGASLAYLRKQAKDSGMAWIDFEVLQANSKRIAYHGYIDDIDKLITNAEKFEAISDERKQIALVTRKIANQRVIELKKIG